MRKDRSMINKSSDQYNKDDRAKVLIVSLYGAWPDFIYLDNIIIRHLQESGFNVDLFFCDAYLPMCDMTISYADVHGLSRENTCRLCLSMRKREHIESSLKSIAPMSEYAFDSYEAFKELKRFYPAGSLSELEFTGINMTAASNQLRLSNAYLLSANGRSMAKGLIQSGLLARSSLKAYLEGQSDEEYSLAIMTHPHRSIMSGMETLLSERGIPVLGYVDCGTSDETSIFFYSMDECYIARQGRQPPKYESKRAIASNEKEPSDDISAVLSDIYKKMTCLEPSPSARIETRAYAAAKPEFASESPLANELAIRLKQYKLTVTLFMSSEGEEMATTLDTRMEMQISSLKSMIKLANQMDEILFVVRDHPNRYISKIYTRPEPSYWFDLANIYELDKQSLNNFIYVYAWDQLDSYSLVLNSDIVICPFSSLAREAKLAGCFLVTSIYSPFSSLADIKVSRSQSSEQEIARLIAKVINTYPDFLRNSTVNKGSARPCLKWLDDLEDICSLGYFHYKFSRNSLMAGKNQITLSEAIRAYVSTDGSITFNQTISRSLSQCKPNKSNNATGNLGQKDLSPNPRFNLDLLLKARDSRAQDRFHRLSANANDSAFTFQKKESAASRLFGHIAGDLLISTCDDSYKIRGLAESCIHLPSECSGNPVDNANGAACINDVVLLDSSYLLHKQWSPSWELHDATQKIAIIAKLSHYDSIVLCALLAKYNNIALDSLSDFTRRPLLGFRQQFLVFWQQVHIVYQPLPLTIIRLDC